MAVPWSWHQLPWHRVHQSFLPCPGGWQSARGGWAGAVPTSPSPASPEDSPRGPARAPRTRRSRDGEGAWQQPTGVGEDLREPGSPHAPFRFKFKPQPCRLPACALSRFHLSLLHPTAAMAGVSTRPQTLCGKRAAASSRDPPPPPGASFPAAERGLGLLPVAGSLLSQRTP